MKKVIAVFSLAAFMLASTEAGQLLKLPFLFHHFIEHRGKNDRISFVSFLKLHYSEPSNNDNDEEDDMKLPFKTASQISVNNFIFSARQADTRPILMNHDNNFSLFQNKLAPYQVVFAFFHPPRI